MTPSLGARVALEHLFHRFMRAATIRTDRDPAGPRSGRLRPRKTVAGRRGQRSPARPRTIVGHRPTSTDDQCHA